MYEFKDNLSKPIYTLLRSIIVSLSLLFNNKMLQPSASCLCMWHISNEILFFCSFFDNSLVHAYDKDARVHYTRKLDHSQPYWRPPKRWKYNMNEHLWRYSLLVEKTISQFISLLVQWYLLLWINLINTLLLLFKHSLTHWCKFSTH